MVVCSRNCEKEKALVEKEKHLILDHTSMNDSELISFQLERDELIEKLSRERATVELWHSRCRKVKEIFADIKPVTNSEKSGHYNKLAFIMFTLPSSTIYDNEAENNSRSYNTNGGSSNIKLTDFYDIVAHDDVLKRVFTPLDGKEPYLLTQYPAETITSDDKVLHFETRQDQNMIAWIVQQVSIMNVTLTFLFLIVFYVGDQTVALSEPGNERGRICSEEK